MTTLAHTTPPQHLSEAWNTSFRPFENDIKFQNNHFEVRLFSEVDHHSIYMLCDLIDLGFTYYRYPEAEIRIYSPGGAVDAMHMFLERLSEWRRRKLVIRTKTDTMACSAAAVILALGNYGQRFARERSLILFHLARIGDLRNVTAFAARSMGESLMKTDKEIIGIVAAHAMRHRDTITLVLPPGATIANIAELEHEKGVRMLLVKSFKQRKGRLEFTKSEYTDLIESFFDLDMAISPFLAKFLGLIDHVTDAAGRPATFQKKETKKTKTERGLIRE